MNKLDLALLNQTRATLAFVTAMLEDAMLDGIGTNDRKRVRRYVREGQRADKRFHRWIEAKKEART